MSKVTSKLQVTLPKAIANQFAIRPGDELDWVAAGDTIRVMKTPKPQMPETGRQLRLHLFDQATERQRKRDSARKARRSRDRGWKREDLYVRGGSN